MKKLFIAFLGFTLFISCSSDDDKNKNIEVNKENKSILLKDNTSNKNYSLYTGYIEEKENNSFYQENRIESSSGLDGKVLVNYDGNKLYTITSKINEMSFFIEKINEK